jgi:integrase
MAIFKQAQSRFWWISIYTGKGKPRKYIPTGTENEHVARAMESNLKAAMRGNLPRTRFMQAVDAVMGWDESGAAGLPVSDLWTVYLQTKPRAGSDTIRRRRYLSEAFCKWIAAECPSVRFLHDVTPQHACAFADQLATSGNGKTQNNRIGNLKTVFSAVAARANLRSNPFSFVGRADQSDARHGRAFTPEEQIALLAECKKAGRQWYEISMTSLYTGLRLIDLANLQWSEIKPDHIALTPSKTARHGITVRIPLHPKIRTLLDAMPRTGSAVFTELNRFYLNGRKKSGYMDIIAKAKIKPNGAVLSFHCWRHTFRTRLAAAAVPQEIAMKLGGWTNESTAEIYNHDFTQLTKAIESLD